MRVLMKAVMLLAPLLALAACAGASEVGADVPSWPRNPTSPERWLPAPGLTWQVQLQGEIDTSVDADVYEVDLFDVSVAVLEELHAKDRRAICYFSAGSLETWRPDASDLPRRLVGRPLSGWPNEYWLDIRKPDLLAPFVRGRLDLAVEKGCDAVDPDNLDGHLHHTGFSLDAGDSMAFARFLAREAHMRGLSIGLKNNVDLIPELLASFDFAVNEECFPWGECEKLLPFIDAGKAVFGMEYETPTRIYCPTARELGLEIVRKRMDLGAYRETCR